MKEQCKKGVNIAIGHLAACMEPLMPMIIAGSLVKLLCIFLGLIFSGSDTQTILSIIGDAPFYLLPILVALTASEHFKVEQIYAVTAAGTLLVPDLAALLAGEEAVYFLGLPVLKASYSYSILPVVLLVWIMSKIGPWIQRKLSEGLQGTIYPFLMLVISVLLGLLAVGPFAILITDGIVAGLNFLSEHASILAWPLLAGTGIFFIMFGTGLVFDALAITQINTAGFDSGIMAAFFILNMALFGMDLAVILRRRHTELGRKASAAAVTVLLAGVAEPTVFGICMKDKKLLRNVVIASGAAGIFQGIVGIYTYVFSVPGLCAILMFYSPERISNMIYILIVMILAFSISFILSYITLKEPDKEYLPE